jgi:hypothetical protein
MGRIPQCNLHLDLFMFPTAVLVHNSAGETEVFPAYRWRKRDACATTRWAEGISTSRNQILVSWRIQPRGLTDVQLTRRY